MIENTNPWVCNECKTQQLNCDREQRRECSKCLSCGPFHQVDQNLLADVDQEKNTPCWCGEKHPYYAPIPTTCEGYGHYECKCGGDFCACHNHGSVECDGCPDCEGDDDEQNET